MGRIRRTSLLPVLQWNDRLTVRPAQSVRIRTPLMNGLVPACMSFAGEKRKPRRWGRGNVTLDLFPTRLQRSAPVSSDWIGRRTVDCKEREHDRYGRQTRTMLQNRRVDACEGRHDCAIGRLRPAMRRWLSIARREVAAARIPEFAAAQAALPEHTTNSPGMR